MPPRSVDGLLHGRKSMKTSSDHILTSHVGSLPRPDDLIAANRAREAGEATDEGAFP
jgi:5-methyltetrahydropteroyltriglutamate--homocysteine methyltransferase